MASARAPGSCVVMLRSESDVSGDGTVAEVV